MPLGARLYAHEDRDAADLAAEFESLGYASIWTGELWGPDAFVTLATVADRVGDVPLGTAIVDVFSRSPARLAAGAASLDAVAHGPVRLGIGPSTQKAVRDLHGTAYDRPVRRLHETAELVRAFTSGSGRVAFDGECFSVADFPALDADVEVYAAALGPAARRATGRVADGWLPHNVPFDHLGDAFETVAETARAAGRDPDRIRVSPYLPAAVSDDGEAARSVMRGHLAYYVGSGEGYRRAVATGFPDRADRIASAWAAGRRDAARSLVSAEMVDALSVAGDGEDVRTRTRDLLALDAVDEPIVVIPAPADDAMAERTIRTLATVA